MSKISFGLSLGLSFDSISLKLLNLDKLVDNIEKWRCIVFGPDHPKERDIYYEK